MKWPWFCSSNNYVRKLITGVVPPLILTIWQGVVVPQWFYYWCQVRVELGKDRPVATIAVHVSSQHLPQDTVATCCQKQTYIGYVRALATQSQHCS